MEVDLAGMYSYSVAYDGGRITHCNIGMGERSAYPNPLPTTLEARKGDLIRMTLGAVFDNYQSNISRTAVIDNASAEAKKRWKAVVDAQESALEALAPGGRVMIRDIVMEESRTSPPGGALFAVNMLVGTEGGGTYTFAELAEDLRAAGFADAKLRVRDERMNSVVEARREDRPGRPGGRP